MDNRRPSQAPTMNLHPSRTELGRADPLKHIFRAVFELLPAAARGHVVATLGEFLGTMLFITLAFACVDVAGGSSNKDQGGGVSTKPSSGASPSYLLYAALGVGISNVVTAWVFFRISGGLFNPVISLGMALIGAITWARCLCLVIAQTSATIIASFVVNALFNGGLGTAVGLGAGTSPAQGVIIEMILTGFFCFTIFMLAAEQHAATHLAPLGIGLALFVGQAIGLFYTGAAMNPARALAPCIVNREFPTYHWIYWVGPICGTLAAVLLYKLVKALEYETAQDEDAHEKFLLKQKLRRQFSCGGENFTSMEIVAASQKKKPVVTEAPVSMQMPAPPQPAHIPAQSIMANVFSPVPSTVAPTANVFSPLPAAVAPKAPIMTSLPPASAVVEPSFDAAPAPTKIPTPPITAAPTARPGPSPVQAKKEEVAVLPECYAD